MANENEVIHFKNAGRKEFIFLEKYGFSEIDDHEEPNEFSITFANNITKVVVEGIHWGKSARVALGKVDSSRFENYDLGDLLSVVRYEQLSDEEF
ncbi:MAG: hypothetical protein N0E38_19010 [Candidatus Thiodiazotropha endolucinida]|nr:hypothetical protein [Candidatus Thiodiazotropha taylori]MCW4351020.1 hypothetical protein [Candidatus Thiodiazotropha endolucinida]